MLLVMFGIALGMIVHWWIGWKIGQYVGKRWCGNNKGFGGFSLDFVKFWLPGSIFIAILWELLFEEVPSIYKMWPVVSQGYWISLLEVRNPLLAQFFDRISIWKRASADQPVEDDESFVKRPEAQIARGSDSLPQGQISSSGPAIAEPAQDSAVQPRPTVAPADSRAFAIDSISGAETIGELQRLAELGHVNAMRHLGLAYADGNRVPQNFRQAEFWLTKAADGGCSESALRLAQLNLDGRLPLLGMEAAQALLQRAAQAGLSEAQYQLGILLAGRKETASDPIVAHMWLNLSRAGGFEKAKKALVDLTKTMSRNDIDDAQRRAKLWSEKFGQTR